MWNWCLQRNILITAEHLPGVSNVLAGTESRTFIDSSDWKLQPKIIQYFLKDREIDLFATRLTNQLKSYVSWQPVPQCCGDGRFFNRLESDERICVSTIQSHPTDINEGYKRQCEHSASSTSVANSTLVATTATAHSPTSSTSPHIPNSSRRPVHSQGNPSNVPETATSRLDYFQQLCTTAGLSNTVTRLLSSATHQSNNKS